MCEKLPMALDKFLNLPEVKAVTENINDAVTERREAIIPQCRVFHAPYIRVTDDDRYTFNIDREADRMLPDIINNRVQVLTGSETCDDAFMGTYTKQRNIGIVFSGGPAPGGHNVIAGLFDAAKKANPHTRIFGFLQGPDGIIENQVTVLTKDQIDAHRNMGGFGMIKTGRTKIDTPDKKSLSRETCRRLGLDTMVVVGGDDSNTNAAFLAQEMFDDGIQVIGVPKTIDGDVQVKDAAGHLLCAMSFGFHSAARAFSQDVSNLCTDCSSDMKYWHICKVMGRSASHLALEVACQTHANITLIGEDLADYTDRERIETVKHKGAVNFNAYGITLRHLSRVICDAVVRRAAVGKSCGVLVIPEGVLEFINEIQMLIVKLNAIIAQYNLTRDTDFHAKYPLLEDKVEYLRRLVRRLVEAGAYPIWNSRDNDLFNDLPEFFQDGLLTERDSHGNFQFSQVETDKVIMGLVKDYLHVLREKGIYKIGIKRSYYDHMLKRAGLDPDRFGSALFDNYQDGEFLLTKKAIISLKMLKQTLITRGLIKREDPIPGPVENIYKKTVPQFKTQTHFYGYDGRGSNPTEFDCRYTYNLGLTVFNLIANGVTGQMAAIKNLEKDFSQWEPIGIPIAPLMHLEERMGKLSLVLEKTLVDLQSPAFRVVKALREEWLAAVPGSDNYRIPGPIHVSGAGEETRPITLVLNDLGHGHSPD